MSTAVTEVLKGIVGGTHGEDEAVYLEKIKVCISDIMVSGLLYIYIYI